MPTHTVRMLTVWESGSAGDRTTYIARCSCGWASPKLEALDVVREHGGMHELEAERLSSAGGRNRPGEETGRES